MGKVLVRMQVKTSSLRVSYSANTQVYFDYATLYFTVLTTTIYSVFTIFQYHDFVFEAQCIIL